MASLNGLCVITGLCIITTASLGSCGGEPPRDASVTVSIRDCAECALEHDTIVSLNPEDFGVDFTYRTDVVTDFSLQQLVAAPIGHRTGVLHTDFANGEAYVWGAEGQGPGEFRRIDAVHAVGDSILVVDGGRGQLYPMKGGSGRTIYLRGFLDDAVELSDGRLAMTFLAPPHSRAVIAGVFDREGQLQVPVTLVVPPGPTSSRHLLAAAVDSGFWIVSEDYEARFYSGDGRLKDRLQVSFESKQDDSSRSKVVDVSVDGEGKLWVLWLIEFPRSHSGLSVPEQEWSGRPYMMEATEIAQRYSFFLDILDEGHIVTRYGLPTTVLVRGFSQARTIYMYDQKGGSTLGPDLTVVRLREPRLARGR